MSRVSRQLTKAPLVYVNDFVAPKDEPDVKAEVVQTPHEPEDDDDDEFEDEELDLEDPAKYPKPAEGEIKIFVFSKDTYMDGEYKIVPETSVQLIDRQFVHGEIVKSLERKQSGVIIDVRVTLELLHEHSKATLRGVDACKVTHLYPVTKGSTVVCNNWIGVCEDVAVSVQVRMTDGSLCCPQSIDSVLPISDRDAEIEFLYPGMRVKLDPLSLQSAQWVSGSFNPVCTVTPSLCEGRVYDVRTLRAAVKWIVYRPKGPESNPEPFNLEPPALVPYEALYRVDNNEHASFYLGDKVVLKASHNTAEHIRELLAQVGIANYTPTYQEFFRITGTKTHVTVQWQDGTITDDISTCQLAPYDNVDEHEFFPMDLAARIGENGKPINIGIVQSVSARNRMCRVRWDPILMNALMDRHPEWSSELAVKAPGDTTPSPTVAALTASQEQDLSVYELRHGFDYQFRLGDMVVRVEPPSSAAAQPLNVEQGASEQVKTEQEQSNPNGPAEVHAVERSGLAPTELLARAGQSAYTQAPVFKMLAKVANQLDRFLFSKTGSASVGASEIDGPGDLSWIGVVARLMPDGKILVRWFDAMETLVLPTELLYVDDLGGSAYGETDDEYEDEEESENEDGEEDESKMDVDWSPSTREVVAAGSPRVGRDPEELAAKRTNRASRAKGRRSKKVVPSDKENAEVQDSGEPQLFEEDMESEQGEDDASWETVSGDEDACPDPSNVETPNIPVPPSPRALALGTFEFVEDVPEDHAYRQTSPATGKDLMKRINQEHEILRRSLPEGIHVRAFENRLDLLRAFIMGPAGTPYAGVYFLFDVQLPTDYPQNPPQVYFHSWTEGAGRLNPNLYEDGKVCLSLLGTWHGKDSEKWSPLSSILQVLVSIEGLVLVPEPYYNEAGFERFIGTEEGHRNSIIYNESISVLILKYMGVLLTRKPSPFDEFLSKFYFEDGGLEKIVSRTRSLISRTEEYYRHQDPGSTAEADLTTMLLDDGSPRFVTQGCLSILRSSLARLLSLPAVALRFNPSS